MHRGGVGSKICYSEILMSDGPSHLENLVLPNWQVAQQIIDNGPNARKILLRHQVTLEVQNQCAMHELNDPDSVKATTARNKVWLGVGSACIAASRTIGAGEIASQLLKSEEEGNYYWPDSDPNPSVECYQQKGHMRPLPQPYARFLTEHADLTTKALIVCEKKIAADQESPYHDYLGIVKSIHRKRNAANNAHIINKQAKGRPLEGPRQVLESTERPWALWGDRDALVENAHLMMQSLIAADIACGKRDIVDPDSVMRIILNNRNLFLDLIGTTAQALPYYSVVQDAQNSHPYAGTFRRIIDACEEEGMMRLEGDRLIMPYADIKPEGRCPLHQAGKLIPPPKDIPILETYYATAAANRGISAELLPAKHDGGMEQLFFVQSVLLARDLFLGTSLEHALCNRDFSIPTTALWFSQIGSG